MFKRILVVFENERISEQAVSYSRELALRMDSEVTFLMLVEMAFINHSLLGSKRKAIGEIETRLGVAMSEVTAGFIKKGIAVSIAIRVGDPPQELVKFLAERLPFQAVIWGSSEDMPKSDTSAQHHWIKNISGTLECPLFTVSSKTQPGRPGQMK